MAKVSLISREANVARVAVELTSEEVRQHFQRFYRENAAEMRVPGFRKGKIPANVIRQRLGVEVINQHMDGLLKEAAVELACAELELYPRAGQLVWHASSQVVEGTGATYEISIPVLPEVSLPDFSQWQIEVPRLEVTEQTIARYKQRLRERFRKLSPKSTPAQVGDALDLSISSNYAADGAASPFQFEGMTYVIGEEGNLPGWDDRLLGREAGAELEFDYTMPENFADARVAGKVLQLKARVSAVSSIELPELDEAFVTSQLRLASLADFESVTRATLEREAALQYEQLKRDKALDRCIAELKAEITPDMLEREIDSLIEENDRIMRGSGSSLAKYLEQKGQELEEYRKGLRNAAEGRLRFFLAVHTISRQQGFEVSSDDMRRYAMRLMQSEGLTPEQISELMRHRGFLQDASFEILRDKSVSWIAQQVQFTLPEAADAGPQHAETAEE